MKTVKAWWLSFANPGPKGFLGVVIIKAPTFEKAIEKAWRLGINPGGQVKGLIVRLTQEQLREWGERLLTRSEGTLLGRILP